VIKESLISNYREMIISQGFVSIPNVVSLTCNAIAYFQYLNSLSVTTAVRLYKAYILSDGKVKYIKYENLIIPLNFDELLISVSLTLMNYKDIIKDITLNDYTAYVRQNFGIAASYITLYNLIESYKKIGLNGLEALRRHWTIINKEFIPYILKKLNNNDAK